MASFGTSSGEALFELLESRQMMSASPMRAVTPDSFSAAALHAAAVHASATLASTAGTGLTAEYFAGTDFNTPTVVRTDATVNFDWKHGVPDPDLAAGHFSAQWTGQVMPITSGTYTFTTRATSGTKLTVNGQVLVDTLSAGQDGDVSGSLTLTAGQKVDLQLDYAAGSGANGVSLLWAADGLKQQIVPRRALFPAADVSLPASAGLSGTYYLGENFNKPVMQRADASINFKWNGGTPDPVIQSGQAFSAIWTGQIQAPTTGNYTFTTKSDDGVKLWVNGQQIISDWKDQHATVTHSASIALVAGQRYDVKLEYYQCGLLPAVMRLKWAQGDAGPQTVQTSAMFGSGTPMTPTDLTAVLDAAAPTSAIDLTWHDVPAETGFLLERSDDAGATWTPITTTAKQVTAFDDTGLTAGTTYQYRVTALNNGMDSSPSTVVPASTALATPQNVAASASGSAITVAWSPVDRATGYTVLRSFDGSTDWTPVGQTSGNAATLFTDSGLANGTPYFYEVVATDGDTQSFPSSDTSAVTAPGEPTNVVTVPSGTTQTLSWDATTGATGYTVFREVAGSNSWTTVGTTTGTTLTDTGLSNGTTYYYRVVATNAAGASDPSAASTTESGSDPNGTTAPDAPLNVLAAATGTTSQVSWNAAAGATGYTVQRSLDGTTSWATVGTTAGTSLLDPGLAYGDTYYYRVIASNTAGDSTPSTVASDTTTADQPTGVGVSITNTTASVSWTAAAGATSYLVQRSVHGANTWSSAGTTASLVLSDSGLADSTAYDYRVIAVNAAGQSTPSAIATGTTVPASPTLSGTMTAVNAILTWTAEPAAANYTLERSPDGGTTWTDVVDDYNGTAAPDSTTLNFATTYEYEVFANNAAGSTVSNVISLTTAPGVNPAATATTVGTTSITVSWNAVPAATAYRVERSITPAFTAGTITQIADGVALSVTDTGLTPGTTYYYYVQPYNAAGDTQSNQASATTTPSAPTSLAAASNGNEIDLSWTASPNATSYTLQRSLDQTNWTTLSSSITGTSYADTGLASNTLYDYQVFASVSGQTSAASNTAGATTAPAAPTIVTAAGSGTSAVLGWTASAGASSYTLLRSTDQTHWTTLTTQAGTSYTDTGLTTDSTYYYKVTASNTDGGNTSAPATVNVVLAAPTISATATGTEVDSSWSAVTGASSYTLIRSADGTQWTTVAANTTGTSYADTGLTPGVMYYYEVTANGNVGSSAESNPATATTVPAVPVGVNVTTVSDTELTVGWTAAAGATGYKVLVSTDHGSTYSPMATVSGGSTVSFNAGGLTGSSTYYFEVEATNAAGTTAPSTPASGATSATPPAYASQTVLYGLGSDSNVYQINQSSGAITQIGSLAFATSAAGRDPASGNFYYLSQSSNLTVGIWNPANNTNTTMPQTYTLDGGVARASFRDNGLLYFLSTSTMYALNVQSGVLTTVGTLKINGTAMNASNGDMSFGPDGSLYIETSETIYKVTASALDHPVSGAINGTLIGSTGTGSNNLQVSFAQNGTLFGFGGNGQLYTINLSTGAATQVASTSNTQAMGDLASVPLYDDLGVTQSANGLAAGGTGSLTVHVTNAGQDATNAPTTVTMTLDANESLVSATGNGWTFYQNGQNVTGVYGGNIAAGSSPADIVLSLSVSNGVSGSLTNLATVSSTIFDSNSANNTSTLVTPI